MSFEKDTTHGNVHTVHINVAGHHLSVFEHAISEELERCAGHLMCGVHNLRGEGLLKDAVRNGYTGHSRHRSSHGAPDGSPVLKHWRWVK